MGVVAFLMALMTAVYHGFLFGKAKAIPVWSSPILPVLSLFVALSSGVGLALLIFVSFAGLHTEVEIMKTFILLATTGTALIIFKLLSLGALASIRPGMTYTESINKLKLPLNTTAVLSIICMALLSFGLIGGHVVSVLWISSICGVLLLASGYIFRHSIIKGGCRYSLQIPY